MYTLLDALSLNFCNSIDALGIFFPTLFNTLPLLPDLYRRILPNNVRIKLKSNVVFFPFAHFAVPFAHRAGAHTQAMCYRDIEAKSSYFTSRCTFFIVHSSLVSKDAFHYVILAIVRTYLVKSASPNSVKLCRTKLRICKFVNFLPNSISFTLPSWLR